MEKCARGDLISSLADKLLNALKHLHHYGIIHRDIKLPNILVTANDEIKLGITSSLTPTSTAMVGVCILELLTEKAAWGRICDDEIKDKLRQGRFLGKLFYKEPQK
ncbi:hypothetical protein RhiirC2_778107 [Rhizophagus irregularis]|uniref:Protein kinase domain-containing protein n=1 Tax=Rhizophagus irregularis TaxID=588596 RepID=A0A2N1NCY3_9GLOM|nr:hypothetical protein RhiirC2_778107 [Rhizophagus irregularis]